MAKRKLSNIQSIFVLLLLGLIPGYLFFGEAIGQWVDTNWTEKTDANSEKNQQTGNNRVEIKGNVRTTYIEKVPPRFVAAPDINDVVTMAKIRKQAIDPAATQQWLQSNQSLQGLRVQMEVAKLNAERAGYMAKQAKSEAEIRELKPKPDDLEGQLLSMLSNESSQDGSNKTDIFNPETNTINGIDDKYSLMDIRIKGYSSKTAFQFSSVTLQLGNEIFRDVTKGQNIANRFHLKSFDDARHCVVITNKQKETINACYN